MRCFARFLQLTERELSRCKLSLSVPEHCDTRCFAHAAVRNVIIPMSIREIGEDAFLGCRNMSSAGESARGSALRGADLLRQCIAGRAEVFDGEE